MTTTKQAALLQFQISKVRQGKKLREKPSDTDRINVCVEEGIPKAIDAHKSQRK